MVGNKNLKKEVSPVNKKTRKYGAGLAYSSAQQNYKRSLFRVFWKEGLFYALELFLRTVAYFKR